MEYSKIKNIDKKCSRYIIGTMNITNPEGTPEDLARLDDAVEQGINVVDSAASYGYPNIGSTEFALGKWIESRGLRDHLVITTKCAHPSFRDRFNSFDMEADLCDTLTKLKTDHVEVLYLHRDNPNVPVAHVMETLDKMYRQGKVLAFGAANWSFERIKEANDYALANGLQPFSIVEEHYSVAEMVGEPFVAGSGSFSGPKYAEARKYCVENNIPVASYSCLSGGFCTGRITREAFNANPDSIPMGTRNAYCCPNNFTRVERAALLAKEKGVTVAQICMAYTMSGELDCYPIIGALNHEELMSSIAALDLRLTKAECDWIDLTSDER